MKIDRKKVILVVSVILVLIHMGWIFSLSSKNANASKEISGSITEIVIDTIENILPSNDIEIDVDMVHHLIRKNAHFVAYLLLGIIVQNLLCRINIVGLSSRIYSLGICVLYAISDEVHQLYVPGRSAEVGDVIIDSSGAAVGIILYLIIIRLKKPFNNI